MRGEHDDVPADVFTGLGSSPHARGTLRVERVGGAVIGIIPACAGNTWWWCGWWCCGGDHPRMRGEHHAVVVFNFGVSGSSPHARGTPLSAVHYRSHAGIIPACAGNTIRQHHKSLIHGDHPRMRGEHLRHGRHGGCLEGSSPHARGTP